MPARSRKRATREVIIERPDGSRITVIVNIRPVTNELGGVIGAINCFYDITSRKQTEEALRARESELELVDQPDAVHAHPVQS